jgi:hypothetical protein
MDTIGRERTRLFASESQADTPPLSVSPTHRVRSVERHSSDGEKSDTRTGVAMWGGYIRFCPVVSTGSRELERTETHGAVDG